MVRGLSNRTVLYPDKLMRVRVRHDLVLPGYIELFFQVPDVHERLVAKSKSSAGQNGVSGSDIKAQPLALPPLPEQHEIVRRVDELFALADQVEARYAKAKHYVDGLKQSILAKAFRGELVPQDPNDEPATVLIERIREARATKPMNRRKKNNQAKNRADSRRFKYPEP
jgi:type I restriction enzyme, S subunit